MGPRPDCPGRARASVDSAPVALPLSRQADPRVFCGPEHQPAWNCLHAGAGAPPTLTDKIL